ncbi:MAG: N-acetyltransferase family protein, partial [Bacteroidota bacterium]
NASIAAQDSLMVTTPVDAAGLARQMSEMGDREGYWVLVEGSLVNGWGVIKRYSPRAGYRWTAETSVYLRRDQRGRGHGTRLQRALMTQCRAWGDHHLVAKIWASNARSIALHERLGYERVGVQREVGFVGGQWRDVILLQCIL